MTPHISQQRGRAMSSSVARALDWREREVLRRELLADPADWTHRARLAVHVGQREWAAGVGGQIGGQTPDTPADADPR